MTTRTDNTWIDKLKSPALWLTLLGSISYIAVQLNNISVLEDRLQKKISIQNEMKKDIHSLELKVKELEVKLEER
jgi:hypothetical protein